MTYGEFKTLVLSLINQYSVAGSQIDPGYNNQIDYLKRIPSFLNSATSIISTTAKYIQETALVTALTKTQYGKYFKYTMPAGFFKFKTLHVLDTNEEPIRKIPIKMLTDKTFLAKDIDRDGLVIVYYRYPNLVSQTPADNTVIDMDEEACRVAALYVAAHLVMYDDAYHHSALYNEYETALSRIGYNVIAEIEEIEDDYEIGVWY